MIDFRITYMYWYIIYNLLPSVFGIGCPHDDSSHINVAPVLSPAADVHYEHFQHPQAEQGDYNGERCREGALEGVGEPAVVARGNHYDVGLPEGIDIVG